MAQVAQRAPMLPLVQRHPAAEERDQRAALQLARQPGQEAVDKRERARVQQPHPCLFEQRGGARPVGRLKVVLDRGDDFSYRLAPLRAGQTQPDHALAPFPLAQGAPQ